MKIYFFTYVFDHSVEKDGSSLSDEKQTIQTSLFDLLKDFLKAPTPEELHSVLAYILTVGEEKQVVLKCFICVSVGSLILLPFDLSSVIFHFQSPNELSLIIHTSFFYSRVLVSSYFQTPLKTLPSLNHISWYFILLPSLISSVLMNLSPLNQAVRALDVLYELLRSSPPREQVQTVLLEWGVEQLYCLLLTPNFGDGARERVFRVRTTNWTSSYRSTDICLLLQTPL